ncbi:hypothetical protein AAVH_20487 [Aphelenchoides avenae]|nr:hypothetical protein AAVH_20487 [Aphelenchus avenae]
MQAVARRADQRSTELQMHVHQADAVPLAQRNIKQCVISSADARTAAHQSTAGSVAAHNAAPTPAVAQDSVVAHNAAPEPAPRALSNWSSFDSAALLQARAKTTSLSASNADNQCFISSADARTAAHQSTAGSVAAHNAASTPAVAQDLVVAHNATLEPAPRAPSSWSSFERTTLLQARPETTSLSASIAEQKTCVQDTEAATDAIAPTMLTAASQALSATIADIEIRIAPMAVGLSELKDPLPKISISTTGPWAPTRSPDTEPERDARLPSRSHANF